MRPTGLRRRSEQQIFFVGQLFLGKYLRSPERPLGFINQNVALLKSNQWGCDRFGAPLGFLWEGPLDFWTSGSRQLR